MTRLIARSSQDWDPVHPVNIRNIKLCATCLTSIYIMKLKHISEVQGIVLNCLSLTQLILKAEVIYYPLPPLYELGATGNIKPIKQCVAIMRTF